MNGTHTLITGAARGIRAAVAHALATEVCPGYTETDIPHEGIANVVVKAGRSEAETRAEFTRVNPPQRLIQPEEVADVVRWLCSHQATSITGQAISVSGGEVM